MEEITKHEENDETLWQYVSDNEGPTSPDDDDDSDVDQQDKTISLLLTVI